MRTAIYTGAACALSLITPAISSAADSASANFSPTRFDSGALAVEQLSDQGPPLIFIPGLASGPWVWRDSAERLRKDHAVYLLTLPGFDGREPVPGATLESLAEDLRTLIETRKLKRPVLVGHSLGGTLGMSFAADHSGLIAGVVAVDGLPVFPGTERMAGDRSPLAQQARAQLEGLTPGQFAAYQQTYMRRMGVIDEAKADRLALESSRSNPRATADFAAQLFLLDLRPRLKDITVPVIEISPFNAPDFAAMGVDEAGKTSYYRMLLQDVAKLDVISVSPARHFVMFDQPEKFAAALDLALAKVVESGSGKKTK
jgi:pimeloyl-ACP methyl ester carboxylesterase